VGKTKRGKGSKITAIADRQGLPIAVHVESATPHEVTLVRATLAERFVRPLRLLRHAPSSAPDANAEALLTRMSR
jgi:hypothetical protein